MVLDLILNSKNGDLAALVKGVTISIVPFVENK